MKSLYTCIVCFDNGRWAKYRNVKVPKNLISNLEKSGKDVRFLNAYDKKTRSLRIRLYGFRQQKPTQFF